MDKKTIAVSALSAALLTALAIFLGSALGAPSKSDVSVVVNSQPGGSVIVKDKADSNGEAVLGVATTPASETTYWTGAGNFGGDLTVGGDFALTDSATFSGTAAFSATTTFSARVLGTSVVGEKTATFTAVTTTPRLCAIQNDYGADRVLSAVAITYVTSSVTGGINYFNFSQSATIGATTTSPLFENDIATPTDGLTNITATSSLMSANTIWRAGSYVNFIQENATNTFSGTCRVTSY